LPYFFGFLKRYRLEKGFALVDITEGKMGKERGGERGGKERIKHLSPRILRSRDPMNLNI